MKRTSPSSRSTAARRTAGAQRGAGTPGDGADPYEAAVRYLANRPRSVAEIERHLRGKRVDADGIAGAIEKLRAQGYIDDEAFARYWLEQRARFRPKGDRALVSELLVKGIARETIDLVLGERAAETEVTQAREALRRPLARWAVLDERERKRKIQQYLAARGFSYDTIEAVIAHPMTGPADLNQG